MKYTRCRVFLIVTLFLLLATLCVAQPTSPPTDVAWTRDSAVVVATNAVTLPPGVEQIADILGPKAKAVIAQVVIYVGTLSLVFGWFSTRIDHWLRDRLNKIAEGAGGNTDVWLANLFTNPIYRFLATLLNFISVNLPTIGDLDRAVQHQREAVAAAKEVKSTEG